MMDRIVIVSKKSRLDYLILEHQTESLTKFKLESAGQSFALYENEDIVYKTALDHIRKSIPNDLQTVGIVREELPNFQFRTKDLIIICGPDGLFANVAKYLKDQLVLTVNPDPNTVAGVLMLFKPEQVGGLIASIQKGEHNTEHLPFVKAIINDDKTLWGINDIFVGRKDHISARYEISFGGQAEHQSSSGIIVSTVVGSTGWLRSIQMMVAGITGGRVNHKLSSVPDPTDSELVFVVREPFPSPNTGVSLVTGRVVPGRPLVISSEMPSGGYIFSDGVTEKAILWNAGDTVTISVGDRFVNRVIQ